MFELVAVTNRHLCRRPFLEQLELVAAANISAVILREKDLTPEAYAGLAIPLAAICRQHNVRFIEHSFALQARQRQSAHIHLPLHVLTANPAMARDFATVGVSVHNLAEAQQAAALGAGYLVAGHVFDTACKANAPPRGLSLLTEIRAAVNLPLYAIGGIDAQNIASVQQTGVSGACLMSSLMQAEDPNGDLTRLWKILTAQRNPDAEA